MGSDGQMQHRAGIHSDGRSNTIRSWLAPYTSTPATFSAAPCGRTNETRSSSTRSAMPTDVSPSPRKRGRKPNQRLPLHDSFIVAIRANGPIGPLATIAGFPHPEQLYYALRHPIPVHAINVDRL